MMITTVIEDGLSQLILLPAEVSLPQDVMRLHFHLRGKERIISPTQKTWDAFFLNGPKVSDDFMDKS